LDGNADLVENAYV